MDTSSPYPVCGICLEPFQVTHSPIKAVLSANSSTRLPFGLRLPCPSEHAYCIACLSSYIQSKLDPEGDGGGSSGTAVFPIRCPECSPTEWIDGIPDNVADRILGEKGMVLWVRVLLISLPERIDVDEFARRKSASSEASRFHPAPLLSQPKMLGSRSGA